MKKHLYLTIVLLAGIINYLSAQNWSLTGNAGTLPAINFLGTTDNKPLILRTKNTERLRILPDGRIGIGIKTPTAYFHEFGTMQIENNSGTIYDEPLLTLRSSAANGPSTNPVIAFKGEDTLYAIMGYDFSTRDIVISAQPALYAPNLIVNHDNGFVGINTKTPQEQLHVAGNQLLDGSLTIGSTGRNEGVIFTKDFQNITFATPGSAPYPMIYMSPSGSSNNRMVLARSSVISNTGLEYDFNGDKFNFMKTGTSKLFIDLTNGRVGINDATPSYPLDVNGYTHILGNLGVQTAPGTRTIQCGSTQGALIGIGTSEFIQDAGSSTLSASAHLIPTGDGFYSLGSSSYRWNTVWAMDGTINTSDARDKINIRDLNYGLKEIMQLHAVKFNWKNNTDENDKLGVIAQEIKKVLPEVVRDWEYQVDEKTGAKTKVPSQRLGVMYSDIIPVLIIGMQEQQKEIEDLKQLIQQLTNNSLPGAPNAISSNAVANNPVTLQNTPNPVKNSTAISYSFKNNYKNVQIIVTDNNGKTIKAITINNQNGRIIFDASALTAGAYYYSLIADEKLLATKTMMVSK